MPDNHPSGSILSVNNSIKGVLLPLNTRTPVSYVITLSGTAPTAGATTVAFTTITPAPTVARPLIIEDGTELTFGAAKVIAKNDDPAIPYQTYSVGTAGNIKCLPLIAPLPLASATHTTMGLLELLGVQGLDLSRSTNLISIRSQKSGLGNEQRSTSVSATVSVSGWIHQRDLMFKNVLEPCNNQSLEMYTEIAYNDGRTLKGAAYVGNLNVTAQLDDVLKFSCEVGFQGNPVTTFEA